MSVGYMVDNEDIAQDDVKDLVAESTICLPCRKDFVIMCMGI